MTATTTAPEVRQRCRNQRCRSKLPVPTDNHRKAFCSRYCYDQFYNWRCRVCETPIQKGRRRRQPDTCIDHHCRKEFRHYPDAFSYPSSQTFNYDERSAHFTGPKSAIEATFRGYRIIAGPACSPPEKVSETEWRERDLADQKYVAEDEARLERDLVEVAP